MALVEPNLVTLMVQTMDGLGMSPALLCPHQHGVSFLAWTEEHEISFSWRGAISARWSMGSALVGMSWDGYIARDRSAGVETYR